jgi:hypothetical protein
MPYLSQDENTNRELLGYNHKQKIIFTFKTFIFQAATKKMSKKLTAPKDLSNTR